MSNIGLHVKCSKLTAFVGELIASGYKDGGYSLRGRSNWLQIGSVRCAPATRSIGSHETH
jgi:hypothetical protein